MTNQPAASRFDEHSLLGIGASLATVLALGLLFTAIDLPTPVQASMLAIAVGLPAAIAYRWQSRHRDKTEDAARIAKGELRRPIGLVVSILIAALFLAMTAAFGIVGTISAIQRGIRAPLVYLLIVGPLGFVVASYASHYLGKHPYRWTVVAAAIPCLVFVAIATLSDALKKGVLYTAIFLVLLLAAFCLPFIGASLGGAWYGRRHQAKFLAKKLERMRRKASRAAAMQQPPPASGPELLDQLKKLGELRDAGVLTEDEFQAKKTEILARI
jgi:hypothetical protein